MGAEPKMLAQKKTAPMPLGIFAGVILIATAIGAGAIIFFFNPSTHGFYPVCMFHLLTGWNCPGCGATRALYALLHGNFLRALKDNALFVAMLAVLAIWGARLALQKMRNRPVNFHVPVKFLWTFLVIMFVFAIVRNLPGFEWLSP